MNRKVLAVGPLAALVMIACVGIMPLPSSPAGSGAGRPITITVGVDQPGALSHRGTLSGEESR